MVEEKEENKSAMVYGLRVGGPFSEKPVDKRLTAEDMNYTIGDLVKAMMRQKTPEATSLANQIGNQFDQFLLYAKTADGNRIQISFQRPVSDLVRKGADEGLVRIRERTSDRPYPLGGIEIELSRPLAGGSYLIQ